MADIDLTWGKQIPPGTIFKYRDMGDGTHAEVVAADAQLDASDIEIGAVEIKNSTDDTRATVGANGLYVEVRAQPGGVQVGAVSVDVNLAIVADVDAAVAAAANLRLMGWAIRESAASAAVATCQIKHGATGAGGTVIAGVELGPDESTRDWFGPQGIDVAANGLSIDWIAGTLDVMLFWGVAA